MITTINYFLLPILGGYLYLNFTYYFKFYNSTIDSQRVVINSVLVGMLSVIIIQVLWKIIFYLKNLTLFEGKGLDDFANFIVTNTQTEEKIVLIISFLFCLLGILVTNLFWNKNNSFDKIIKRWGNSEDYILYKSLNKKNLEERLLLLTFRNNKIYIAFINYIQLPINDQFVNFIPIYSGYRDPNTLEVAFTTDYSDFILDNEDKDLDNKLGICCKRSDLLFVSQFDFKIFENIKSI